MSARHSRLRGMVARFCRPTTVERLIDPALADLQIEYDEARMHHGAWHARFVLLRGYAAFWFACALQLGDMLVACMRDSLAGRRGALPQMWWLNAITVTAFGIVFGAITFVFVGSSLADGYARLGTAPRLQLIISVLLQGSLALPLGTMVAGATLRQDGLSPRHGGLALVALTFTATALAIGALISIPDANQFLRESVFGGPLSRGANELSFTELSAQLARPDPDVLSPVGLTRLALLRLSYHARIAFVVTPTAFACLGVTIAAAVDSISRRTLLLAVLAALYSAYYILPDFERWVESQHAAPELVAWAPCAAALALIALLLAGTGSGEHPGTLRTLEP